MSHQIKQEEFKPFEHQAIKKHSKKSNCDSRLFKDKKVKRSELRYPRRRGCINRKEKVIEKKKKCSGLPIINTGAHLSWGMTMDETKRKREDLLQRRVMDWRGKKPLIKLKR